MATVGVEKVAKVLNVSVRRVQQLVDLGMPRESRGQYDLGKCAFWMIRHQQQEMAKLQGKLGMIRGDDPASLLAERKRLISAQADREELELKRARGELIPVTLFESELHNVYMTLRQRLLTMKRIAPQLEGETRTVIGHKIDAAVRGLLVSLATGNGHHNPSEPGSPGAPPADQVKG